MAKTGEYTHSQYVEALKSVANAPFYRRMLQAHYCAPNHTITATRMSVALGYPAVHGSANLHYGKLSGLVGTYLKWTPKPRPAVSVLCDFAKQNNRWVWIMRPNLAKALERLRWISEFEMPEEIESNANLYEGRVTPVLVNKYERNVEAREICISRYGCKCAVCEMVLQDRYGKAAQGFIHVHHLKSLAEIGAEYKVDPIVDLRPVCPTCHAVIHLRKPSYTIKEVKSMLAKVAEKLKE